MGGVRLSLGFLPVLFPLLCSALLAPLAFADQPPTRSAPQAAPIAPDSWVSIAPQTLLLPGPNGEDLFAQTVSDIPHLIGHFRPKRTGDLDVQNVTLGKSSDPQSMPLTFKAVFTPVPLGLESKKVQTTIQGTPQPADSVCTSPYDKAYRITVGFSGSDPMVTDYVSELHVDLCLRDRSDGKLEIKGYGFLKTGKKTGGIEGGDSLELAEAQAPALIKAITDGYSDVLSKKWVARLPIVLASLKSGAVALDGVDCP